MEQHLRLHLILVTLLTTASATNGGGTCRGALQCNAEACYDCSCVSGVCSCGAGWLGNHCETPFCSNRTSGCSGHGECRQSLHNVTCTCDTYYSGDHCQIKECSLDCKHGGFPNLACDKCQGCKGAWTGTLCDQWDSTVPQSRLMSQLFQISNASKKMLEDQQQFHPICAEGHECVGWGIDMFGKPTAFPVVHLTYDPSRTDKKFNGLSEPLEVVANHVVNPVWSYVDGANAFPRVGDFVQHVNTQYVYVGIPVFFLVLFFSSSVFFLNV